MRDLRERRLTHVRHSHSTAPSSFRCPIKEACLPGVWNVTQAEDVSCDTGYRGPMCTLCITGYNKNSDGTCSICGSSGNTEELITQLQVRIRYLRFTDCQKCLPCV